MTRAEHLGGSLFFRLPLIFAAPSGFLNPPSPHPSPLGCRVMFPVVARVVNAGTSQNRPTCTQEGPIASTHNTNAGNSSAVTCGAVICCQRCFRPRCFHPVFITYGVCPLCFCVGGEPLLPHPILYFFPPRPLVGLAASYVKN